MNKTFVINARNCNDGLAEALALLEVSGVRSNSRNGPVLKLPGPVVISYSHPGERVMFSGLRDANPFFHLFECLWMMAGCNDAASVGLFAKQMLMYANKDGEFDAAYGYRWRNYFKFDQTKAVIAELRADPLSRRAVIAMWSPQKDLNPGSKSLDLPCNTHIYFNVENESFGARLNMTVCNRSNDAVWGAFGANFVHMGFLQEYIADCLNMHLGTYWQISNNLHIYTDRPDVSRLRAGAYVADVRYLMPIKPDVVPVGGAVAPPNYETDFIDDCAELCFAVDNPYLWRLSLETKLKTKWALDTALPVLRAHMAYRDKQYGHAEKLVGQCASWDWREACLEWLDRRGAARRLGVAS